MKKILFVICIGLLIIFTSVTKNSSKQLETKIHDIEENIRLLENKRQLLKLEYDFLSSPQKLSDFNETYFKNELKKIELNKLNKISNIKDNFFKNNDQ
tara:strand:- start:148 stop:441 length:294 start_codon:yes stop_codon:yes gene_type:complete